MVIVKTGGVPAKIWVRDIHQIEEKTLEQIKLMATLPHLVNWIAVMPDCHLGRGAVVGSVVATSKIVVPNIVGVDIGCGICAIDTGIDWDKKLLGKDFWREWSGKVKLGIPTGFGRHRQLQSWVGLDTQLQAATLQDETANTAAYQLGTLGGGNHFLEAQVDPETNHVWFMVHSGSRHTGLEIATYYDRLGRAGPPNLNYLYLIEDEGQNYLVDMAWAIGFALENRYRMLEVMLEALAALVRKYHLDCPPLPPARTAINIHHNFANRETHYGQEVVIHRKGATQAQAGQLGIIPGSMGASSYIVEGKGSVESFMSCSHGAGRVMSRTRAKAEISPTEYQRAMAQTFTKASINFIDEAPQAYKNIDEVIALQSDLISVKHKLLPIITIKGDPKARED